jgi:hypothetical protein
LLSTVEQGALLLHSVCRTTLSGRTLATDLANRVNGDAQELQCPVGTEQIAGLVLEVTRRIPGLEVAMAQAVDESIASFPTLLDRLGAEQVSQMDGCAVVDAMMNEVFRLVRELTGYGDGTDEKGKNGNGHFVLDPMAGFGGIKTVKEVTLSMPDSTKSAGLPELPSSPRSGSARSKSKSTFKSQSARAAGLSVPPPRGAPAFRNKLMGLGSPRWYPQDQESTVRQTDAFLSPLRRGGRAAPGYAGRGAAALAQRSTRIGNSSDMHPTARLQTPPSYATSIVGPSLESARLQQMIEQKAELNTYQYVAPEESKPFSEVSDPSSGRNGIEDDNGVDDTATWAAATAPKGQRKTREEERALVERGPRAWTVNPPPVQAEFFRTEHAEPTDEGVIPTQGQWHLETRNGGDVTVSVAAVVV